MKKVLVYRHSLLPVSETFVRAQILSYRRWHGVLAGVEYVPGSSLEGLATVLLGKGRQGICNRIVRKISEQIEFAPPSVLTKLRGERPQIAHVHFGTDAVTIWRVLRRLKIPVVVTLHGYDINTHKEWWEQGHGGLWRRTYPKRLLAMADNTNVSFIAVSEAIRKRAMEFGIPGDKVAVRYIGIDTSRFAPGPVPITERKRRILFVGRLVEVKGCRYVIEAFARVKGRVHDAELAIVGSGALADDLKRQAHELDIPVEFLGALPPNKVKQQLDQARGFCLPSARTNNGQVEGFGLVLLEAQASGVPVVTSALAGATEGIVEGKTGYFFPERDVDMLANRLEQLLLDDSIVSSFSLAGPAFVGERFDIGKCTALLEDYYDDVVRRAHLCKGQQTVRRSHLRTNEIGHFSSGKANDASFGWPWRQNEQGENR